MGAQVIAGIDLIFDVGKQDRMTINMDAFSFTGAQFAQTGNRNKCRHSRFL
jgi:hypothetical protein